MKCFWSLMSIICFIPMMLSAEADTEPIGEDSVLVDSEEFDKGYLERQTLRYEMLVKKYREEIQALMKRNVEEKKRLIELKYANVIRTELENESSNRNDAIVLFEGFIKKYPNSETFTPSAMYRLAELYYERSILRHESRMAEYEKRIELFESGQIKKEPEIPAVNYADSIALYQGIVDRFPSFRYVGGAYYMLGFCLDASNQQDRAVGIWTTIVENEDILNSIDEKFLIEVYYRIGEYYFNANNLDRALAYFNKGIKYRESNFYDKVMYKLAWTYYRQNKFEDAVSIFTDLIQFADRMKAKGEERGQDLRKEAVQYIAISFSDEEWGSVEKAIDYFNSIEGATFEIDVFEKLGKFYQENSSYAQAEKAYRFILDRHPLYENSPKIHFSLIQSLNKARELDKAFMEMEVFSRKYSSESEWAQANRNNVSALKFASEQTKDALLAAASFHHRRAEREKEKSELEKAKDEYRLAALSYMEYLDKYPYTSESYDISWYLADSLYESGDIEKAVVVFERIRDDKNQDKFRKDAADATFRSYYTLWTRSSESTMSAQELSGKPFSKLEEKLIESTDVFLKISKDDPERAAFSYQVARIFYNHGKFEEAERRYLQIINEFPTSELAFNSARDIIAAYNEKKDWVNVAKWSKLLTDRLSLKKEESAKAVSEFKTYRMGALFNYAEQLQSENKYKEAAEEFLRVVEENPYTEKADIALYNAAVAYQKGLLFDSALKLHERVFKEYPYSDLAPQSLYLVAYNAENSYDFDKAVDAYERLYKKYPADKNRAAAIYNAGFIKENLKRYRPASVNYYMYYKEKSEESDGKEALYRSALMYEKAKDWQGAIKRYLRFIKAFRNDPDTFHLVMRSYNRIAQLNEKELNRWNVAMKNYRATIDYFTEKKIAEGEGLLYAAEAKFKLLEDDYTDYEKMKIAGKDVKKLGESLKSISEAMKSLDEKYKEVLQFKVAEWSFASLYRRASLVQLFADKLYNAPIPPELSEEEAVIYEQMIQEQVAPLEEKAVNMYVRTLENAREQKIFNKWTQLIIEKLSTLRPDEYKVGKKSLFALDVARETGYPVLLSLDKSEKKAYTKSGIKKIEENKKKQEPEPQEQKAPLEEKSENDK